MSGRAKKVFRKALVLIVCVFLCMALLSSPGAWAQSLIVHLEGQRFMGSDDPSNLSSDSALSAKADDEYDENGLLVPDTERSSPRAHAEIQSVIDTGSATPLSNDDQVNKFIVNINIGGKAWPCTFRIISPNEVQVGTGIGTLPDGDTYQPAIPEKDAQGNIPSGDMVLPEQVVDPRDNKQYKVTAVGRLAFWERHGITSTGLDRNATITRVEQDAYSYCYALKTTGLKTNHSVKSLGQEAFVKDTTLTTTDLKENSTLTTIGLTVFLGCSNLTSTDLGSNHTVKEVGRAAFEYCVSLEHTGLETNQTLTTLGIAAFGGCSALKTTGLAENQTITTLPDNVFGCCTSLTSTGLEKNTHITSIGSEDGEWGIFQRCDKLSSTGLESNVTLKFIGRRTFIGCSALGEVPPAKDLPQPTNTGDLVLNYPADGSRLVIGDYAFTGTNYQTLYLPSGPLRLDLSGAVFADLDDDGTKAAYHTPLSKLYVPSSWQSTTTWSGGSKTFTRSEGTLVVMSPSQTLSATRTPGTSDAATLTFTINRSFKADISHAGGTLVQNASFEADPTKPLTTKELALSGLPPSADELTVQITDPGQFVYPAGAPALSYNSVQKGQSSCELAPIKYTIHFDVNGAAGSMADMQGVSYGSDTTLTPKPDEVCRENMQFDHWSTLQDDKDADGQINLTRKDGAPIGELPAVEGGTITLFAQWDIGLSILSFDKVKGADTGALQGVGYTLKTTNDKKAEGMQGLFTLDAQGQKHPIQKDDWPLLSDTRGKVGMYYLPKGTYYLFNERASAGYTCLESSQRLVIDKKDGQIITTLDGVPLDEQNTSPARISIAFEKVPFLPTTGTIPAGLLQAVGTLIAASTCIALIRRSRNRKQGGIK